jgi:hypothetical protein
MIDDRQLVRLLKSIERRLERLEGVEVATVSGGSGVSGSGTTSYLSKWTSASSIGDSDIIESLSGGAVTLSGSVGSNPTITLNDVTGRMALGAGQITSSTSDDATIADHTHSLDNSGVSAATYGSATQVPQFTVDAKGRVTLAANVAIQSASTTQPGIIELATNAETQTGTATDRAVTPAGLRSDIPATPTASRGVRLDGSGDLVLPGNVYTVNGKEFGIDGDVRIKVDSTNGYIDIILDDAAGADKVRVLDSAGNPVFIVDSAGYLALNDTAISADRMVVGDYETPAITANQDKTIANYGDGAAYFRGRDITNNIEFLMGTSISGGVFAGAMTNHDFWLRTQNLNRITILASGLVGINDTAPAYSLSVDGTINTTGFYRVDGTQVVTNRQTGWTAATGTADRTTFATGTVTLSELAERVKALIDDLITHGLIGT